MLGTTRRIHIDPTTALQALPLLLLIAWVAVVLLRSL